MTQYRYTAIDSSGMPVRGILEADDEHALYSFLKDRGLLLQKSIPGKKVIRSRRVNPEELIEFSHQMAFVIESGVPIMQGLQDLRQSIKDHSFRSSIESVIADLSSGDSLSQALARHPHVFPASYGAIITAGETSGNLAESFRDIGRYLEWLLNLRRQIKQALLYPTLVITIMAIAMVIFITYVIPRLVIFIQELNRPLPIFTKILIWCNTMFLDSWPYLLGLFGGMVVILAAAFRFERTRLLWDQYKLHIPKAGELLRDLALVRFVSYLRMLYRSGIQVHQSFSLLGPIVGNRFYVSKLNAIRGLVMGGESLADAMQQVGGFPTLVERSFRIGERTGSLDTSLEQLGAFMNRQIDANVKKVTSLLEPILLMVIGSMVIFIIISVLWPVYGILGEIG